MHGSAVPRYRPTSPLASRRLGVLVVGLLVTGGADLSSQTASIPGRGGASRRMIAAAEQRGLRHPLPSPSDSLQMPWRDSNSVGTDERRCVEVTAAVVQSGDFTVGDFGSYPARWRRGGPKLGWTPRRVPSGYALGASFPLEVEVSRIDSSSSTVLYRRESLAQGVGTGRLFFATEVSIPSTGWWLLVARAGTNWGCVIYHLR